MLGQLRVLLDTNIVVRLINRGRGLSNIQLGCLNDPSNLFFVSAVSLWEIAIKQRKGKLNVGDFLSDLGRFEQMRVTILPLSAAQAIADTDLPADLKDPFDRIIAAVAVGEGMPLMTTDRALLAHPLAWRP